MSGTDKIELRSDEVREILGTPPRWIIRWGITTILCVILVLLIGSYFYKYPDLIRARVTVISENPPVNIVARVSGKIDKLFISDKQNVNRGDLLGIIENPADYNDVYKLKGVLDTAGIYFISPDSFKKLSFNKELNLGSIQPYYTSFVSQFQEFLTNIQFNYFEQRIESLKRQKIDYNKFYNQLVNQVSILEDDMEIADKQLQRVSSLREKGAIADIEFEKSKADYLKQKLSYQTAVTNLSNTLIEINKISQQIQEQEIQKTERDSKLIAALKERYENLTSQIAAWEQDYVLIAPAPGKITFNTFWSINQFVTVGNVVFTVVPDGSQVIIGRALVPVSGAGKVEPGQKVNIKLDNFPYVEYGLIEGSVENISLVPLPADNGSFYTAEIELPDGLLTNYNKILPGNQEMQGIAEIITKDRRLIERLVQPLVSLFRERITITIIRRTGKS